MKNIRRAVALLLAMLLMVQIPLTAMATDTPTQGIIEAVDVSEEDKAENPLGESSDAAPPEEESEGIANTEPYEEPAEAETEAPSESETEAPADSEATEMETSVSDATQSDEALAVVGVNAFANIPEVKK